MQDLRSRWTVLIALLIFGAVFSSVSVEGARVVHFPFTSLLASSSTMQFGSVSVGSSKILSDYIYNPTNSSVTITSATVSGADFQISRPAFPVTLAPRQRVQLVVVFSPHGSGPSTDSIVISSTANPSSMTVSLSGSGAAASGGGTPGQIVPSPSSISFGSVAMGSRQSQPVTLTNSGTTSLLISQAVASSSDFVVSGLRLPVVLAANSSVNFSVVFAPQASGARTGAIALTGNSSLYSRFARSRGTPLTASISLSGVGGTSSSTTPGALATAPVAFGTVPVGTSQQKMATITNSGGSSVTVGNAVVTGTGFSMSTTSTPMTLAPNQSASISITCAPKTAGALAGALTVNSDASNATLTVPLTVTGVSSGALTISPSSFNFGSVQPGSTQSLPATLTNSGGTSVTVSQATFTGAGYSITGLTLPLTLAAGQTAAFNVVFAPQTAGTDNFNLSVTSDASNPTLTASVAGTAAAPGVLTASAPSLSFGTVTVGGSKTLPETVTNSGGSSITLSQTAAGAGYTVSGLTLPVTLAAGKSASFNVVFSPTSAVSSVVSLAITTSNPSSTLSVPLSGLGATSGTLTVNPVSFGSVAVGSSSSQIATLKNSGGSSLTITSASMTGSGTGFGMTGLSLPLTLSAGQTFTFNVTFAPQTAGAESASIALVSDASSSPSIALSGTATAAGQLGVSPSTFSFGSVTVGASKSLPITLSATGGSVTVTAASVTSAEFKLTGPALPITIQSGATAAFTLTYNPQASGASSANVSFSIGSGSSPIAEAATGSGLAAPQQHSVQLSWSPSQSAVSGYNVYRGPMSGGPYTKIDPTVDVATNYTDSSVQAGQTYFYVTTAVASDGTESSFSNQVTAAIPTP